MALKDVLKSEIQTDHYIKGERVRSSGQSMESRNPANNELNVEFNLAGADVMDQAVKAARDAFDNGPWPNMLVKERVQVLNRFADLIRENAEHLGTIESYDVGKLLKECINHDVARGSANIKFFASAVQQWGSETFFGDGNFLGRPLKTMSITRREPIGVAGLISPWNSPLMLATWKVAPCLATGNTCVLKPSPWALLSVLQLGEYAKEAGMPDGVFNIVAGDAEAGKALVSNPMVDRVSFTGSVPVGKAVAQANAAARMASVSLELGGKSPSIVFDDADLGATVQGVARGIFRSQGQSCVAGSRVLIQETIYDSFLDQLTTYVQNMKIGSQLDPTSQIGPLINKEHFERVEKYIATGVQEGGKVITGGKRPEADDLSKGFFLEPTIFADITDEMTLWKEEVFGPVLVVRKFKDEAEALSLANDSEFGLSSSVWTTNYERAMRMSHDIESGMVWINSHFVRDLRAPFGGTKESGIGREGGRYSMEFFTEPKMICMPI